MARVLLSHAASDRPRVRRLAEGLRRAGYEPHLIEDEVRVGHSVLEVLERGLRESEFVVACLSQEALRSGWVEAELRLIIDGLPQEQPNRLVLVRFDEVEIPKSLQERAFIDAPEERWDEGVSRLVALLHEMASARPAQPRTSLEDADWGDEAQVDAALSSCSPLALELMKVATVFAPGHIPTDWWVATAGLKNGIQEVEAAFDELAALGLVRIDVQRRGAMAHPLAVARLRAELAPDAAEGFKKSALAAMARWAFEVEAPLRPDVAVDFEHRWPQVEALLQMAPPSTQPSWWSALAMTVGSMLVFRGEEQPGRELLEQALAVSEPNPDLQPIALESLKRLTRFWRARSDTTRAKAYLDRAVTIAQALPEERRHKALSDFLEEYAWMLLPRDPVAAKQAAQRALELVDVTLKVTDAVRAQRLFTLALCTRDTDGAAAARPSLESALQLLEKAGLGDTPQAATVLGGLASVLLQLRELEGAGIALERARSIEQKVLGSSDPRVAMRLSDLAEVRVAEERFSEARMLFERARDLLEARYGPDATMLGPILHNLGLILLQMEDREGARACLERAVRIFEREHGPEHPYVVSSRAALALTLDDGSHEAWREMERVLYTGLTLYLPKPGVGAEQLQRALVLARSKQAPPAEVSNALSEALRAAEEGGSIENAARAALLLGAVLGSRGAWESAQGYIERALRLSRQSKDERLVAEAYRLLGDANLHGSHYEDARMNYAEAIRRYEALDLNQRAAKTRLILLTTLLQLGRIQEIDSLLPPLRRALEEGLFTDARERADAEQALRLAESSRGPKAKGNTV
jgi:tetratricopeptide (TPR) repeat protein